MARKSTKKIEEQEISAQAPVEEVASVEETAVEPDQEQIDDLIVIEKEENPNEEVAQDVIDASSDKKNGKIIRYLDVDKDYGLTTEVVNERINSGLVNRTNLKTTKSGWQIIRDNTFTFFNIESIKPFNVFVQRNLRASSVDNNDIKLI